MGEGIDIRYKIDERMSVTYVLNVQLNKVGFFFDLVNIFHFIMYYYIYTLHRYI